MPSIRAMKQKSDTNVTNDTWVSSLIRNIENIPIIVNAVRCCPDYHHFKTEAVQSPSCWEGWQLATLSWASLRIVLSWSKPYWLKIAATDLKELSHSRSYFLPRNILNQRTNQCGYIKAHDPEWRHMETKLINKWSPDPGPVHNVSTGFTDPLNVHFPGPWICHWNGILGSWLRSQLDLMWWGRLSRSPWNCSTWKPKWGWRE